MKALTKQQKNLIQQLMTAHREFLKFEKQGNPVTIKLKASEVKRLQKETGLEIQSNIEFWI